MLYRIGHRVLWTLAVLVAVVMLVLSVPSHAATITANWIAPTTCADGTLVSAGACTITKYTVYSGLQGAAKTILGTTAPGVTTFSATNIGPGTWCLQASASSAGGESALSTEACKTIAPPAPASPSGLTLTVGPNTTAFTLVKQDNALLALAVGSIPANTACIPDEGMIAHGVTYNAIPTSSVVWSGTLRPTIVFALCS